MKQLRLDLGSAGERIDVMPLVKVPNDVYRLDIRVTFRPDDGRIIGAVETSFEHSRELCSWVLQPEKRLPQLEDQLDYLAELWAEAKTRYLELQEPF